MPRKKVSDEERLEARGRRIVQALGLGWIGYMTHARGLVGVHGFPRAWAWLEQRGHIVRKFRMFEVRSCP